MDKIRINGKIRLQFGNNGKCVPLTSPVAVQLDRDDRTVVEPAMYGFEKRIPVQIWEGRCTIDLQEMKDYISFLKP